MGRIVTSLRPELLLEGIGAAVELMQAGFSLELIGVRRILEPAATALAAERIDAQTLEALEGCLQRMRDARSESDRIQHDADFHRLVAAASGNETLASMLNAVSSRTIRARAWRGIAEEGAGPRTVAQHQDIHEILVGPSRPRSSMSRRPRPGSARRSASGGDGRAEHVKPAPSQARDAVNRA